GSPEALGGIDVLAAVDARGRAAIVRFGNDGHAFAAVSPAIVDGHGANHATAVHIHFRAVREGVFDRVGVEVLIDVIVAIRIFAVMTAADALGFDRPGAFHPAKLIDVVNVEVAVAAAGGPEEAVEA